MKSFNIALYMLILMFEPFTNSLQADQAALDSNLLSARLFTQAFYDWYVPIALGENATPAWDVAIEKKHGCFSTHLIFALRQDAVAQARSPGEIVGLDFDPFLGSQDPSERYEVGRTEKIRDGYYLVDVDRISAGNKHNKPDIEAELKYEEGHWTFVNFRYPSGIDLLTTLNRLQRARLAPRSEIHS